MMIRTNGQMFGLLLVAAVLLGGSFLQDSLADPMPVESAPACSCDCDCPDIEEIRDVVRDEIERSFLLDEPVIDEPASVQPEPPAPVVQSAPTMSCQDGTCSVSGSRSVQRRGVLGRLFGR